MQVVYLQAIPGSTAGEGKVGQGRECGDEGSIVEGKWHPGLLGSSGSPPETPPLWGQR